MQCDQPVGDRLVVDPDLWPVQSLAGQLGREVGEEDQRARVPVGVAGESIEQPLRIGLGQPVVVEGRCGDDGRPDVVRWDVVGRPVQEQQVDVLHRIQA